MRLIIGVTRRTCAKWQERKLAFRFIRSLFISTTKRGRARALTFIPKGDIGN